MRPLLLPTLLLVAGLPGLARANGQVSHLWISQTAVDLLPVGELRALMKDPAYEDMWRNGSMFPDGGYAIGDGYGESAHWEPFQLAYTDWILETYGGPPYSGESAEHVAFLLGMASHGMADQVYDSLYMQRAHQEDAASDWDTNSMDEATDVCMAAMVGMVDYGALWVPDEIAAQIFAEYLHHEVSADTIRTGQAMVRVAPEWAMRAAEQPEVLADYQAQFPWACANQLDPLVNGNPPDEAEAVTLYWQEIWGRLEGEELAMGQVLLTFPKDGHTVHPIHAEKTTSWVTVVFAHGLADEAAENATLEIFAEDGRAQDIDLWLFHGEHSHVLHAMPVFDFAPATPYTVSVPGDMPFVSTVGDAPQGGQASSFTFTTHSVRSDDGLGCASTPGHRHDGWAWLVLGLAAALGPRRRA